MNIIVIGNIVSLAGCVLMVFVGLLKEKRHILGVQCVQFSIQAVANLMLGGVSGFVANVVSIARNLAFTKLKNTLWLKLFFIVLQLALSYRALTQGLINWLPLLAAVAYTWFLDMKNEVHLKLVLIVTQLFWLVYDFVHLNYVAVAFDSFSVISTVTGIFLILADRKKKMQEMQK